MQVGDRPEPGVHPCSHCRKKVHTTPSTAGGHLRVAKYLLFKSRGGEERQANLRKVHPTLCLAPLPWQALPAAAGCLFFFCNCVHDISCKEVFLKVSSSPFSPRPPFCGLLFHSAWLCLVPSKGCVPITQPCTSSLNSWGLLV